MSKKYYLPHVFARDSLKFMKGSLPTWKIWLRMPYSYCKMIFYAIQYQWRIKIGKFK